MTGSFPAVGRRGARSASSPPRVAARFAVPELRVAMVKDFVALLRGGGVARGDEILASVAPALLRSIDDASRLAWMPAAPIVRLTDQGRALLGPAAWRAVHRKATSDLAERPLFRALVQGARTLFGTAPATFSKVLPRVLEQAHRNYGPIVLDPVEEHGRALRFADCPPEGLSRGILDVFAATSEGLLAASAGIEHDVRAEVEYEPGARTAVIRLSW